MSGSISQLADECSPNDTLDSKDQLLVQYVDILNKIRALVHHHGPVEDLPTIVALHIKDSIHEDHG